MSHGKRRQKEQCEVCGRWFAAGTLLWSHALQAWLCPDCLAEEEGCGCEE